MLQARRPIAADYAYFDRPFIAMAHRGGALLESNLERENTLHAFSEAAALGYRYLETDVHATADGVLLAFHDDRLDRVTDRQGLLAELPWNEVKTARIGGLDAIPTLADLFDAFPEHRINIDIKAPGAIEPLARAINHHRAHDRVCVGSFGVDRIRAFRRLMGTQVPTSVAGPGVAWTRFVPVLPRLFNDAGVVFQMPIDWEIGGRRVRLLTRDLVDRAHGAGKLVHVWTIDDADTMHELIDLGVDGLISDRIDTLKEVCLERGLWT
ncbi:glycerophosphodiester phosphodiesterase family protein [Ammonicoccus fulvus]|uniref:Glycerophosphodiester phosphodiesterase family protein n=1 Tax=Ammonicoccus fulvus TaxID=3138240 RepID=A0ABZ3FR89_9ACTN